MAQCTAERHTKAGTIWYCTRDEGHDGPHRDDRNVAWGFSEAEKKAMRTAEDLVAKELEKMDE